MREAAKEFDYFLLNKTNEETSERRSERNK